MCLAIVKPKGIAIPDDSIRQGWISNSHGGGYAFVKDGKVQIRKGLMKLKDFNDAFRADEEVNPDSAFLLHFRIRSMGDDGSTNTHPFEIDGGCLIHNGTLTGTVAEYSKGPSDTKLFAEKFKKDLSFDIIAKHKSAWDAALGSNKLAMLYDDGRYQIVNESLGLWAEGVWYSNISYKGYGGTHNVCDLEDWQYDS